MNPAGKAWIKGAAARVWSLGPKHRADSGQRAAILCYHSISAHYDSRYDPLDPRRFESHLQFLSAKCHPITMDALVEAIGSGRDLPERAVVVTFDDGYRDNFEVALPLLLKYRVPATIYVVTGYIDGEVELAEPPHFSPLSWEQMIQMQHTGLVTFGAHGRTHRILSTLSQLEWGCEIADSKRMLEERLGIPIRHFAYPNGRGKDIPRGAGRLLQGSGFVSACSTIWGTCHHERDRYALNRVMINSGDHVDTLVRKVEGDYDYLHWLHMGQAVLAGRW